MIRITLLATLLILSQLPINAQTFQIEAKRHSAKPDYQAQSLAYFGEIPPPLIKIERIENEEDTLTILHFGFQDINTNRYEVENHPVFNNHDINMDSVKTTYPETMIWIGFDEVETITTVKEEKRKKKNFIFALTSNNKGIWSKLILGLSLISLALFSMSSKRDTAARYA